MFQAAADTETKEKGLKTRRITRHKSKLIRAEQTIKSGGKHEQGRK